MNINYLFLQIKLSIMGRVTIWTLNDDELTKSHLLGMEVGCCHFAFVYIRLLNVTQRRRKIISFRVFAFVRLGFRFAKYKKAKIRKREMDVPCFHN